MSSFPGLNTWYLDGRLNTNLRLSRVQPSPFPPSCHQVRSGLKERLLVGFVTANDVLH